jgi:hypothetical protein
MSLADMGDKQPPAVRCRYTRVCRRSSSATAREAWGRRDAQIDWTLVELGCCCKGNMLPAGCLYFVVGWCVEGYLGY